MNAIDRAAEAVHAADCPPRIRWDDDGLRDRHMAQDAKIARAVFESINIDDPGLISAGVEADERYMEEHYPEGDGEERVIEILRAVKAYLLGGAS